jgi:hypothetical protein
MRVSFEDAVVADEVRTQIDHRLTRREWTQVIGATHPTLQSDLRAT